MRPYWKCPVGSSTDTDLYIIFSDPDVAMNIPISADCGGCLHRALNCQILSLFQSG